MNLSIIIPTIGRDTLHHTLTTLLPQMLLGDEVLIVGDGPQAEAQKILLAFRKDGNRAGGDIFPGTYWETESTRDMGATQRDAAIVAAKGSHLMFIDDDDSYNPWALRVVRTAITQAPTTAHIFKMARYKTSWTTNHYDLVLWNESILKCGQIGTPMFVVPNTPPIPRWTELNPQHHDFDFILQYADNVEFHPEIIARIRS